MKTAVRRPGIIAMILAVAVLAIGSSRQADAESAQIVAADLIFPEGVIFVGRDLYFVDYARSDVLRLVGARKEVIWHQDGCGANGLVGIPDGLLVACFDSGMVVKISLGGATQRTIRQDTAGTVLTAPNDLTADQKGGFYISDSGSSDRPGKVFYLGGNGVTREVATGIRFANGIGVSPDGSTLYVSESLTGKVLAFPIKADGSLGAARDLIQLRDTLPTGQRNDATPDSLRVDPHGNVFVALYKGGGVAIVSPAGRLLKLLDVPSQHHTSLAISADERNLYVTAVDDDAQSTYRGQIIRMANPIAQ